MTPNLVFLKLGGSLITDKDRPHTARRRVIRRLADEIKQALDERPGISLLLGHGSGSFAHVPAAKYGTRQGVSTAEEWRGFIEVWEEARALNQIVIEECLSAGLPVIAFPPSATFMGDGHLGVNNNLPAVQAALAAGLIPVVNGDVIFDRRLGGTIYSTEEVFTFLAGTLAPARILLAGLEQGVYQDFQKRNRLIGAITPESYRMNMSSAGASASIDVTGGMLKKVNLMVQLVRDHPHLSIQIFSGQRSGVVKNALLGAEPGTKICSTP